MNRVIHKYPLTLTDSQVLEWPIGTKVRAIQMQKDTICVWTEGPAEFEELGSVEVKIVGTGQMFDIENFTYMATVQEETLVWHVYMREV